MTANFKVERVLIWGKTYPELSRKYAETVCTAGVRENGEPIRLYPVPLRYLDGAGQYKLYDWIDAPISKSSIDSRPESYKVDAAKIRRIGHIEPDKGGWEQRAAYIFRDPSWQFASMSALLESQARSGQSIGIIAPGKVERVSVTFKPERARREYEDRMRDIQSQVNFFLPEYKELGHRPFEIRLHWRCQEACNVCTRKSHEMQVLDWGLMELARKNEWDHNLAKARLEELALSGKYDFRLFLGNMKQYQKSFVIIGLWYPQRIVASTQVELGL